MDQLLDALMDLGPDVAPQRIAQATSVAIRTTKQRRAWRPAWRFPQLNTYARLGLIAAALLAVALVGIGLFGRPPDVGPTTSPTPSPTSSAASAINPLVGTWLAPEVTCADEVAAIEAAGYTPEQVTQVRADLVEEGEKPEAFFDPTCANTGYEVRDTDQWSLVFDGLPLAATIRSARVYDYDKLASPHDYRLAGDSTFELGGHDGNVWEYCLTFRYAIDGDQLTIQRIDPSCPGTEEASLLDQIALTAILETSSFTRQP
jgi:hypothetical protein